ncbi:FG-GAP repeat domain-containing protein [Streptomyces sp. NPDC015661]|uniref:FG-GAP repeat domain-containing protein n=1 Tax=Streptomyces sp. NPDC015661 TaxID=3364961 RepID=UPI0036FBE458
MSTARTSRLRLAAAVAAALAVTTAGLTAPAFAAPSNAPAAVAAEQQDVLTVPAGTSVVTSGPTGYLTFRMEGETRVYTWTRHEDGAQTRLPGQRYGGSPGTDIIVRIEGTTYTYVDMSTGTEVASYDTSTLGSGTFSPLRYVGTTFVAWTSVNNAREVHLFSKEQGVTVDRKLTGIPAGATYTRFENSGPDTLVVQYRTQADGVYSSHIALVDVATAQVVETYDSQMTNSLTVSAVSATHLAWLEWPTSSTVTLAVARRGATEVTRTPLGSATQSVTVKLVGDWVTYAQLGGATAESPNPLHTLTARSLTDPQRTVKLLDDVSYATTGPDGGLLASGGTVEQGEGIYRIAPGADGVPAATMVASTGVPTALDVKMLRVPTTVDFGGSADTSVDWTLSKPAKVSVVWTHNATGKSYTSDIWSPTNSSAFFYGMLDDKTSAPLGDYTWKLTAAPANGIGPSVERTGTLKAFSSKLIPHDFSDSGAPDLLVRDSAGRIINYDARQTLYETGQHGDPAKRSTVVMGTGWQIYDRVLAPGNFDASPQADVIARDRDGRLWLYSGTGQALAPRKQIGTGWGIYRHITGGSDLTNDGRIDLLTTDNAGALWLYEGTGNSNTPYKARKKVGTNWGIYNRITGTGNIAGGKGGDLVARDSAGVLWLYLGKGDGTFAPRIKIGSGWNQYIDIVGVGDTDRDGRPDLVVQGATGGTYNTLAVYRGTGEWRWPFKARLNVYNPEDLGTGAVTLF